MAPPRGVAPGARARAGVGTPGLVVAHGASPPAAARNRRAHKPHRPARAPVAGVQADNARVSAETPRRGLQARSRGLGDEPSGVPPPPRVRTPGHRGRRRLRHGIRPCRQRRSPPWRPPHPGPVVAQRAAPLPAEVEQSSRPQHGGGAGIDRNPPGRRPGPVVAYLPLPLPATDARPHLPKDAPRSPDRAPPRPVSAPWLSLRPRRPLSPGQPGRLPWYGVVPAGSRGSAIRVCGAVLLLAHERACAEHSKCATDR